MKQSRIQGAREHRWKQTGQAKEFLSAIKKDYKSSSALYMLDWSGRTYDLSNEEKTVVTFDDVEHGMRVVNLQFSKKERFIRDCFDDLYEKFELIEHFILHDFIEFTDIAGPLEYYINRIASYEHFLKFMQKYDYAQALAFVSRFDYTNHAK
jgi:hypothetical protein